MNKRFTQLYSGERRAPSSLKTRALRTRNSADANGEKTCTIFKTKIVQWSLPKWPIKIDQNCMETPLLDTKSTMVIVQKLNVRAL